MPFLLYSFLYFIRSEQNKFLALVSATSSIIAPCESPKDGCRLAPKEPKSWTMRWIMTLDVVPLLHAEWGRYKSCVKWQPESFSLSPSLYRRLETDRLDLVLRLPFARCSASQMAWAIYSFPFASLPLLFILYLWLLSEGGGGIESNIKQLKVLRVVTSSLVC